MATSTTASGVESGMTSANPQGMWDRWTGAAGNKMKQKNYDESAEKQMEETRNALNTQKGYDNTYYNDVSGATKAYQSTSQAFNSELYKEREKLKGQSQSQANDARQVYNTQVQPNLKGIMESAKSEAANAMSLKDAGDVNNSVQTGVRNLYNQEAQGVQRRGLQDAGVLAGLGAQATGQAMGGMPMSGGQLASIQAQNMSQSGQAYSKAQQRMQALREQGIESGFRESDAQYRRGEGARDRYAGSVNNIQDSDIRHQGLMKGFRDEQYGYGNDRFNQGINQGQERMGLDTGLSGLKYGQKSNMIDREIAMAGDYYGGQQQGIANQMAATSARTGAMMGALGTIGGGVAGGMMGRAMGPAGTMAGAKMGMQAGGQMGGAMTPQYGQTQQQPRYGNYA
jgi:hypothetical protein